MINLTIILFLIEFLLSATFLEGSCVICTELPDTLLQPCGHVLCIACAQVMMPEGCPFDRETIQSLRPLSSEEQSLVKESRAQEDDNDELMKIKNKQGESELMVTKFRRRWKKDASLVSEALLIRIAAQHCEEQDLPFNTKFKKMMEDSNQILLEMKRKKEADEKAIQKNCENILNISVEDSLRGDSLIACLIREMTNPKMRKNAEERYREHTRAFFEYCKSIGSNQLSRSREDFLKRNQLVYELVNLFRGRKFLKWNLPSYTQRDIFVLSIGEYEIDRLGKGTEYKTLKNKKLSRMPPDKHLEEFTQFCEIVGIDIDSILED